MEAWVMLMGKSGMEEEENKLSAAYADNDMKNIYSSRHRSGSVGA